MAVVVVIGRLASREDRNEKCNEYARASVLTYIVAQREETEGR